MTFLELCQRLRSEAGIAGTGPLATTGQVGELQRLVDWVKDAYVDIQDKRMDWDFLRFEFSFSATTGTTNYPKTTVSELANWKKDSFRSYLTSVGINDEQWMQYQPWDYFRDVRLLGANKNTTGKVQYFSIKPDNSVELWPVPYDNHTIVGEYYRKAYTFANDSDEPIFDRYHMAIVYNALMRYAAYVAEPSLYARAETEYRRLMSKLERDFTEGPKLGGAMA